MAAQATRKMVLLLVTALMVMAMMTVVMMAATATSAFAEPKGEQTPENSCGASNPKIGVPAGPPEAAKGEEFLTCGFRNNPHFVPPPGN
jgi:hypothetical protein